MFRQPEVALAGALIVGFAAAADCAKKICMGAKTPKLSIIPDSKSEAKRFFDLFLRLIPRITFTSLINHRRVRP